MLDLHDRCALHTCQHGLFSGSSDSGGAGIAALLPAHISWVSPSLRGVIATPVTPQPLGNRCDPVSDGDPGNAPQRPAAPALVFAPLMAAANALTHGSVQAHPPEIRSAIKRIRFGFRNFDNYRIRALLYAGKPNWRVLGSIVVQ